MGEHTGSDIVRFAGFCFDRSRGCLLRQDEDGSRVPVSIGSRALEVLGLLIDRRGDLVSKDEIMDAVWPGTVVEGANVTVQISALRRILDDGRSDGSNLNVQVAALRRIIDDGRAEGSCIQTVPGRGYRFVVPVTRAELPATAAPGPSSSTDDRNLPARGRCSAARRPYRHREHGIGFGAASWPRSSALWSSSPRWRSGIGTRPGSARHARCLGYQSSCCRSPISAMTRIRNISSTQLPTM
jgi:DNA-binding winged helix-turn-helix (wHTH) protein